MTLTTHLIILVALVCQTFAATYSMSDEIVGSGFYNSFSFEAITDPTHGRVEYVDKSTAQSNNLTYAHEDTFILRADYKNKVSSSAPGRKSVRIISNAKYSTHVAVFNIRHMPQGCATWPAVWETGDNWPNNGEVDIVEGRNDQSPNKCTLHTSKGCTIPSSSDQTGTTTSTDCDSSTNGCGVVDTRTNSYGPQFNNNGGGWYAMERTDNYIKIWFWPRDGSPPSDVRKGENNVSPESWGTPMANFPNNYCNIGEKFGPNAIIINLTLCGDWAGSSFASDGCPGTCEDYVNDNPSKFADAYFDIASVRVYE